MTEHTRRPGVALAASVLTMLGAVVLATSAGAGTPDEAEELLTKARKIATHESFAGVVEVQWIDDAGLVQAERVGARGVDGAFVIGVGGRNTVGNDDERVTTSDDHPDTRSKQARGGRAPRPGESWDLEVVGRHHIAERSATVVTASDGAGRVRARFSIDRETGQLLRRVVLDEHGRTVRVVRFVTIIAGELDVPIPAMPAGPDNQAPVAIDSLPSGFVSRSDLGPYRLLGEYLQPDGAVQLYYSDGLFTASVFQKSGRVDWDGLPSGARAPIDGLRARSYATAAGTIVVWGDRDLVFTAVGDGPPDAVLAIVTEMSGNASEDRSWVDDVTDFVLGPFDWE